MSSGVAPSSLILLNFKNSLIGTTERCITKFSGRIEFGRISGSVPMSLLTWVFRNQFLKISVFGQVGVTKIKLYLISNCVVKLLFPPTMVMFEIRCFVVFGTFLNVVIRLPSHFSGIFCIFHGKCFCLDSVFTQKPFTILCVFSFGRKQTINPI